MTFSFTFMFAWLVHRARELGAPTFNMRADLPGSRTHFDVDTETLALTELGGVEVQKETHALSH